MGTLDGMRIAVVGADGPIGGPGVAAFAGEGASVAAVRVEDDGDATAGVEQAIAELGGLDVLANLTKPTGGSMAALDVGHDEFDAVFKVCLRTTRTSNQAAFRHMVVAGGGHIVNHADIGAELGSPGHALAATAAQAVVAWSRAAAGAWFGRGVRLNIFQPGQMAQLDAHILPTLVFLVSGKAATHGATITC
jgi:NAD(P)-dependent dehydrogenase (short-subunit alcohol dehydrogenase family)